MKYRLKFILLLLMGSLPTFAFALETQQVSDNVYALVGETGPRTAENLGSNNTVGFVITSEGVVLVGSGAIPAGAKVIETAIKQVTSQPVRWVITIGSQDHHWLGNSYFADKGAEILALSRTVKTQKSHVEEHINRLKPAIKNLINTIRPIYAGKPFQKDDVTLNLGGVNFELMWPGNGHFPGDAVLWLPKQKILFTGDFVFLDRILGIHPFSNIIEWQKSVHKLAELKPLHVVPGHGHAADWDKVQTETVDYIDYLVNGVSTALKDWIELEEAIESLSHARQFESLDNFKGWHRRNIHRTYLQLEANQ